MVSWNVILGPVSHFVAMTGKIEDKQIAGDC